MGDQTGELPADYGSDNRDRSQMGNSDAYSGGHDEFGSGTTGGAGFGNKTTGSGEPGQGGYGGNPELARNSDPYSGNSGYGSGATGGAGLGNKMNSSDNSSSGGGGKLIPFSHALGIRRLSADLVMYRFYVREAYVEAWGHARQ